MQTTIKKLFLIILLACIKQVNAQVCFTSTNFPVGGMSTTIACADFNSDGKFDLVVAYYGHNNIYMLLGDGLGGFGTATPIPSQDSITPNLRCFISGDYNKDGHADLAIAEYGAVGPVQILFGDGTGNFPSTNSFAVGDHPFYLCSADFNRDGNLDLATANSGSRNISVLLGNGAGNFSPHTDFSVGSAPVAISSGDFNGDSIPDLAVANDNGGGSDSVWVLLGNGSGSFGTATKYLAGTGPYSVCSKDFNADGVPDLAIANRGNSVSVLLGTDTGSFGVAYNFPALYGPWTIISADFNGDGKPDLATANQSSNNISVLLNVVAPHTVIRSSTSSAICAGLSTTLTVSGSATYTWSSNAGVSNPYDTVTNAVITPLESTIYRVVGGENGCHDTATILINIVTPAVPNICLVTTDISSNYNYNIVYWDKTPYSNIDSFIVYRKDAISLNYLRIGAVSKNSLSEFPDTAFSIGGPNAGNPSYSSWLYKLAIRDTCGNIGAKSPYHQTMFVQESSSNFSWNAYTVETGQTNPITGYSFLRDDSNTGDWHVLINTIGLSTTDPNYATYPNGNWRIDALGFNCTPSMMPANTQSAYFKSQSNTTKQVALSIKQLALKNEQVAVYPNPTAGNFIIETTLTEKQNIQVFDLNNRLVFSQNISDKTNINATALNEGVYNLTINTGNSVVNKKLVIIR